MEDEVTSEGRRRSPPSAGPKRCLAAWCSHRRSGLYIAIYYVYRDKLGPAEEFFGGGKREARWKSGRWRR